MKNIVLDAVNQASSASQSYVQFVQTIQAYCTWIEGQSIPTNSTLNGVFMGCKTNAATWFDTIFPTYLTMPTTIAGADSTVRSDLDLLIQLAGQLQTEKSPAIQASINQYAASLQQTVRSIGQQTAGLSTSLQTFKTNLEGDQKTLLTNTHSLQHQIQNDQHNLSELFGRLHYLESANCPDRNEIAICKGQIDSIKGELNQAEPAYALFNTASQSVYNAVSSLAYLTHYWQAVSADAQVCIQSLSRLQSDPAAVLLVDLSNNLRQWNALIKQFQTVSQQIS